MRIHIKTVSCLILLCTYMGTITDIDAVTVICCNIINYAVIIITIIIIIVLISIVIVTIIPTITNKILCIIALTASYRILPYLITFCMHHIEVEQSLPLLLLTSLIFSF
jgi:hypothetical protein